MPNSERKPTRKKLRQAGEFVVSRDEASEVFEQAVAERIERDQNNQDSRYVAGVAAGLGWAIGEYDDNPLD